MTPNTPEDSSSLSTSTVDAADANLAAPILLPYAMQMRIAGCIAVCITLAIALLLAFQYYTATVRVTGTIVPPADSIKVVAPVSGQITRNLVEDGAHVVAGQALFELIADRIGSGSGSGSAEDAGIDALLALDHAILEQRRQLQVNRLNWLGQDLRALHASIKLGIATDREEMMRQEVKIRGVRAKLQRFGELATGGYVSGAYLRRAAAELALLVARHKVLEADVLSGRLDLQNVHDEIISTDALVARIAGIARQGVAVAHQERAGEEERNPMLVAAPIAGTITGVAPVIGKIVTRGAQLATVSPPGSRLEAQLLVPPRAATFLAVGQKLRLRVDALPYQTFGRFPAEVLAVEQHPVGDTAGIPTLLRVRVRPELHSVLVDGHEAKLLAGMTLKTDIPQERRRLIEWLIKPSSKLQMAGPDRGQ